MSTDPASGTQHSKGTVVNLTVSTGKVELPDVTKQSITRRTRPSLRSAEGHPVSTNACSGGAVTQQSAPAGDIAQGSTVTLTYCAAPAQPTQPAAPAATTTAAATTAAGTTAVATVADPDRITTGVGHTVTVPTRHGCSAPSRR